MAAIDGDYVYVAAAEAGFRVYSVADPQHPVEVGAYETPGGPTGTTGVVVADGFAYVADQYNGLHILRVDDPANPTPVGVYREGGSVWRVAVRDGYAYVVIRTATSSQPGLRILDVHDPAHPVPVGRLDLKGFVEDLALAGPYVYMSVSGALHIVDVSDPAQPREVGAYDQPQEPSVGTAFAGRNGRVTVAGSYVYLASATRVSAGRGSTPEPSAEASGLRVVDISNPVAPVEVGFVRIGWDPDAAAIVGSQVSVLGNTTGPARESGLRVIDVTDPARPVPGAELAIGGSNFGGSVALAGHYAFVASDALHVLDVADPAQPVEVGFHPMMVASVTADRSLIYAGSGSNGFETLRFTPAAP